MISKISKIINVGRFRLFSSKNDDLRFAKTTVVFGCNTFGKSTLTTIFRSLKEENSEYVYGKKTLGISEKQKIEIIKDDKSVYVFNSKWKEKNIEIFDNEFIARNVFYGDCINKEQQSCLYEILIGEDVQLIKKVVDITKEKKGEIERERINIENSYKKPDLGTFNFFLDLKEDNGIDEKIKETQGQIKQQENLEFLKKLASKTPLLSTFKDFKNEFRKTLDFSVEELINKHVKENWKNENASKDFLSQGIDLLKDDGRCVFCGQDLTKVRDFIDNLRKIFSVEYKYFKKTIKVLGDEFINIDLEKEFLGFEKYGLSLRNKLNYSKLEDAKSNINKRVKAKQDNLNLETNFNNDEDFIFFSEELKKVSKIIEEILKEPLGDEDKLILLKNKLKIYELTKYRFSKEGIKIYEKYKDAERRLFLKKAELNKLNKELSTKVRDLFKDNKDKINFFLKKLCANFPLGSFSPKSHLGLINPHFCDYHFIIDGIHEVKISNKTRKSDPEPEDKPHFKNTLSDSDKRILAFAFYLSKLSNDSKLKDKIIILDDPFSSFDENRKEETINLLINLKNNDGDEPIQKIILTHDIRFLCRIFEKLPQKESKFLKIHYCDANGSIFQVCDVENDFMKDAYFKNIEYIKDSIEKAINIDEALKKVRLCLEHLLKRKYYFLLSRDTLNRKSVGDYLKEIGDACLIKDEILKDNWHEDMHDRHVIMELNEPGKIQKLRRVLELIERI